MGAQNALTDQNQSETLIAVQGTAGTTDTVGTSLIGRVSMDPTTGALYVNNLASNSGGTTVNIATGTQQTLGTVGVVNTGTLAQVTTLSNLTNGSVNILTGTVTSLQGTVATEQQFAYVHATGAGTTTVKSGVGLLHAFVINSKSVGGVGTLYDGTSLSGGTAIAAIDTTLSTTAFTYDAKFTAGLIFAWAGNTGGDVTITYR